MLGLWATCGPEEYLKVPLPNPCLPVSSACQLQGHRQDSADLVGRVPAVQDRLHWCGPQLPECCVQSICNGGGYSSRRGYGVLVPIFAPISVPVLTLSRPSQHDFPNQVVSAPLSFRPSHPCLPILGIWSPKSPPDPNTGDTCLLVPQDDPFFRFLIRIISSHGPSRLLFASRGGGLGA